MVWFLFAGLVALFESSKDVFSKKGLKNINEYVVSWSSHLFALPFILPLLLFIQIPVLGSVFFPALIIGGGLNVLTTILYMKAIKSSDLSITVPMVTFTPLFLLLTSPLLVGEFPSFLGVVGILTIVCGMYLLNIKNGAKGKLAPFKAVLKEKGPKLMLLVAFIWSVTSNFDKIGIQNSSPIFWIAARTVFIVCAMLPVLLYTVNKKDIRNQLIRLRSLFPIGLCAALAETLQMIAISLTLVAYVISIKRSSAVISVIFGKFIFNEAVTKWRVIGAVTMVLGVALIALS